MQQLLVVPSQTPVQLSQTTVCPQLLTRCAPLHAPAHVVATACGVQHVATSQAWPAAHEAGQLIVCPQLLTAVVLHFPEQAAALFGAQQVSLLKQTSPAVEQEEEPPPPQKTVWPQLFTFDPHCIPAHVVDTGSGVQPHAPPVHAPASQPPQLTDCAQLLVASPQRSVQKPAAAAH